MQAGIAMAHAACLISSSSPLAPPSLPWILAFVICTQHPMLNSKHALLAAGLQKRVEPKLLLTLLFSISTNYYLFHHSPSSALLTAGLPISHWECFVFGLVHAGLVYMQMDLVHSVITIAIMSDYNSQMWLRTAVQVSRQYVPTSPHCRLTLHASFTVGVIVFHECHLSVIG
jgi:hypothetical protein